MIVAFKFWGKGAKLAEKALGRSPIVTKDHKEYLRVNGRLARFDVMVARLRKGIRCRKCKAVDGFVVDRVGGQIESVACGQCGTEVVNYIGPDMRPGIHGDQHLVSQDEWESIIWADEI